MHENKPSIHQKNTLFDTSMSFYNANYYIPDFYQLCSIIWHAKMDENSKYQNRRKMDKVSEKTQNILNIEKIRWIYFVFAT